VRGVVERITYHNPDNGYTVARLAPERPDTDARAGQGDDKLVTLVGTLPDLTPGEAIVAVGWWENSAKHGWQFKAIDFRTTLPATVQGMKKYLGSGLVRGVGPVMAGRIVDLFGEATFDVVDLSPERLTEVAGIGPLRAQRITAAWAEQRAIREVMAALASFGVSTSLAARIYKKYGDAAVKVVTQEPYRLAREVWGIGWKTADKIAQAVGIPADAPARLEAGALHALAVAGDEGHTLVPEANLAEQVAELLGVVADKAPAAIAALLATGEALAATRAGEAGRQIGLAPFAHAEQGLARRLAALAAHRPPGPVGRTFGGVDWAAAFGWLTERHGLTLAPEQAAAVRGALTRPVSILTGGPGTGKTHALRAVLTLAIAKRLRCTLAAPTGRAAKRMAEATGQPAATLHRLLGLKPGGKAEFGAEQPLPADLVVVDEVSMLDALLANALARAVAPGAHLLLVGDADQLPSVGAGAVLADLIASAQFPVTRLTRIFRQAEGSGIALNARRINAGDLPGFYPAAGTPPRLRDPEIADCFFLPADDPTGAAEAVVELVARRLPARYGLATADVQVLTPMRRGEIGVDALNARLQARLNPGREGEPELRAGGRAFRAGTRVLAQKNNYDLQVFNGDLGVVRAADPEAQELVIALDDGREVRYPSASLHELNLSFALTVHKSQGGEYPVVVLPLLTSHAVMLNRTLLYTAVTRARRVVVVVGQAKALALAARDWRREARRTALRGLLDGTLAFAAPSAVGDAAGAEPDWLAELAASGPGEEP
jgi:exodeoxyribonuclease V alpha subunit